MSAKKLTNAEYEKLVRLNPQGKGAKSVRTKLLKHLDAGGPLDPDDYNLLLESYVRWDKRRWPGALLEKKKDERRDAIVDELLELAREKKFVAGLGSLTSKRRANLTVLSTLAFVLVALGRLRDAVEVFEIYRKALGGMRLDALMIYIRTTVKLGEKPLITKALKAFAAERRAGEWVDPYEKEVAKYAKPK